MSGAGCLSMINSQRIAQCHTKWNKLKCKWETIKQFPGSACNFKLHVDELQHHCLFQLLSGSPEAQGIIRLHVAQEHKSCSPSCKVLSHLCPEKHIMSAPKEPAEILCKCCRGSMSDSMCLTKYKQRSLCCQKNSFSGDSLHARLYTGSRLSAGSVTWVIQNLHSIPDWSTVHLFFSITHLTSSSPFSLAFASPESTCVCILKRWWQDKINRISVAYPSSKSCFDTRNTLST